MKKIIKGALALVLAAAIVLVLFRFWVSFGARSKQAVYLYTPAAAAALNYASLERQLTAEGVSVSGEETDDPLSRAESYLARGAQILVIGLSEVPNDKAVFQKAAETGAQIFFVGAYPGDDFIESYDQAYYIGSYPEYGGELGGRAAAMCYRNGVIADRTGNALLDYLSAGEDAVPSGNILLGHTLSECEHYGVYSEPCVHPSAQADSVASSDAGTTLEQELNLQLNGEAADSYTAPDTASLSAGAAALGEKWASLDYLPEVIYCFGLDAASSAAAYADAAGWGGTVQLIAYTGSLAEAKSAAEICGTVLYYDVDTITQDLVRMIFNTIQNYNIALNTGLAQDESNAFHVPYQVYCTAENDTPTVVDSADSASAAASSAG